MHLTQEVLARLKENIINWMREQMSAIGVENAVIGVSGGKDSSVVAALAVQAFGVEHVMGVLMPQGEQHDLAVAKSLCEKLGIRYHICNIGDVCKDMYGIIHSVAGDLSRQTILNLPPRIRMSLLYGIAQSYNAVVINTSNLSEDWVGYATVYGDTTGAFSPLATLTTDEVIQLGEYLGVDECFTRKVPEDGLTGLSDEEVMGFSYQVLNEYIRTGICEDEVIRKKIDAMHRQSRFKFLSIPMFQSELPIKAIDIAKIYE